MARTLHVYPKASIEGSMWTLTMKVYEPATKANSRFTESVAAGLTVERPLPLLKVVWDLEVFDTDTDQDVADSLFVDDITPGPSTETVWGNWQTRAEGIISGLASGYTVADFWSAWSTKNTKSVRNDAKRAMITQRGWTISNVHQHEGDGTFKDE